MSIEYFRDELIDILKKRDFSRLGFQEYGNGYRCAYCFLYTTGTSADEDSYAYEYAETYEVSVYTPDNRISDETADRMIDVLEHLDVCIQRAYVWLSKQDLRDEWLTKPVYSPQELEQTLTMWELSFGIPYSEPRKEKPHSGRFLLSFDLPDYPWHYDVYFDYNDLQPYKSEKALW